LEIARWALPDADLRVGDPTEALPFDNGTFDVVAATGGSAVLTELARVVRPGGLVAVGSWVRSPGCWAETFVGHLRRLALLAPASLPDDAGLTVRVTGEVRRTAVYPNVSTAWTTMLGCEDMLRAIRLVGETPVRAAFADAVAGAVAADGTLRLPRTFRYVVAAAR
jgi:SAM-dependent methyltransferase